MDIEEEAGQWGEIRKKRREVQSNLLHLLSTHSQCTCLAERAASGPEAAAMALEVFLFKQFEQLSSIARISSPMVERPPGHPRVEEVVRVQEPREFGEAPLWVHGTSTV